jgi:hypothetical protein
VNEVSDIDKQIDLIKICAIEKESIYYNYPKGTLERLPPGPKSFDRQWVTGLAEPER